MVTMAQTIEELEERIENEMQRLNARQRKFVMIYGNNSVTQTKAAIEAGYSACTAKRNANKVYNSTKNVIALVRQRSSMENGESIAQHRSKLMMLHDMCAEPGSPTWEPRTAHSIRRTLLEIDGFIKSTANSGQNVTINIIDPVKGITIDEVSDTASARAVIEHNPT